MRKGQWRIIERMHERFMEIVSMVVDADDDSDADEHGGTASRTMMMTKKKQMPRLLLLSPIHF